MTTTLQTGDPNTIKLNNPYAITGNNGSILAAATTNSYNWIQPNTNFTSGGNNKTVMSIPHNSDEVVIEPDAALNVKGKVIINGENLEERLKRIETLLNIPTRDVEMEEEFPKLKHLWEEYNSELEKYKTWKRLNK